MVCTGMVSEGPGEPISPLDCGACMWAWKKHLSLMLQLENTDQIKLTLTWLNCPRHARMALLLASVEEDLAAEFMEWVADLAEHGMDPAAREQSLNASKNWRAALFAAL